MPPTFCFVVIFRFISTISLETNCTRVANGRDMVCADGKVSKRTGFKRGCGGELNWNSGDGGGGTEAAYGPRKC